MEYIGLENYFLNDKGHLELECEYYTGGRSFSCYYGSQACYEDDTETGHETIEDKALIFEMAYWALDAVEYDENILNELWDEFENNNRQVSVEKLKEVVALASEHAAENFEEQLSEWANEELKQREEAWDDYDPY